MKKSIVLLLLGILLVSCHNSQKQMDIYLCIGQSNMAGRAPINETVSDTLEHVYLFTNNVDKLWEKAANPLNKYSSIRKNMSMQKVGPAFSFAKEMQKKRPKNDIGLIVNAKGGTSIRQWHPDSLFFKEAVRLTKLASQYGQLKGVLWHQGCSDASKWESYPQKLQYMVSQLRKELGNEELPIVFGQLSYDKESRIPFNKMLLNVPHQILNSAVAQSEGLETIDKTHFNTYSQVVLGQRYAEQMLLLLED